MNYLLSDWWMVGISQRPIAKVYSTVCKNWNIILVPVAVTVQSFSRDYLHYSILSFIIFLLLNPFCKVN